MIVLVWQHLLFSVTDPRSRVKPAGVSDVSLFFFFFPFYFLCFCILSFKFIFWAKFEE
jgi:hypothetical protein